VSIWDVIRVTGMPRPIWTPSTPAHHELMAALTRAAAAADAAEEAMWEAARAARAGGVPVDLVAALTRRGRSTVYRHLPAETGLDDDG